MLHGDGNAELDRAATRPEDITREVAVAVGHFVQVVSALSGVPRAKRLRTARENSGRGTFDRGDLKEAGGGACRAMEPRAGLWCF